MTGLIVDPTNAISISGNTNIVTNINPDGSALTGPSTYEFWSKPNDPAAGDCIFCNDSVPRVWKFGVFNGSGGAIITVSSLERTMAVLSTTDWPACRAVVQTMLSSSMIPAGEAEKRGSTE